MADIPVVGAEGLLPYAAVLCGCEDSTNMLHQYNSLISNNRLYVSGLSPRDKRSKNALPTIYNSPCSILSPCSLAVVCPLSSFQGVLYKFMLTHTITCSCVRPQLLAINYRMRSYVHVNVELMTKFVAAINGVLKAGFIYCNGERLSLSHKFSRKNMHADRSVFGKMFWF